MPEAVWSNFPVLELQGPLDIARWDYLDGILEPVKHMSRVTLDLQNVDFVDATAISRFVRLHNSIHPVGDLPGSAAFEPSIRLINVRPHVARLFQLLQLERLFEVHRLDSAMTSDLNLRFLNGTPSECSLTADRQV